MNENPTPLMVALELAGMIIDRRSTLPILENVLLTSDGNAIAVEASDLDIEVSITVPLVDKGGQSFAISVAPKPFQAALEYLGGEASFAMRDERTLSMNETFLLSGMDPDDFRRAAPFAETSTFEVDAVDFLNDLRAVAPCISYEETRYYLNGVYLHGGGAAGEPSLKLAATDGHRLMVATRPSPASLGHDYVETIIPRKLVKLLIGALSVEDADAIGDDDKVRVRLGGENGVKGSTRIEIRYGSLFVRAKCIDGVFPNYHRVVPLTEAGALLVDAAELKRAVQAVGVICDEKGRAAILSFADKTITAKSPENGSMSLPMPGRPVFNLPDRIGLNAGYLEQMLSSFEGEIRIGFGDPAAPIVFRSTRDERLVGVLMPMRV